MTANCTAQELFEDVKRLRIKALITTQDAAQRLQLSQLRAQLGCQLIFLQARTTGPAGLFDLKTPGARPPSATQAQRYLHGLDDQSLILQTSGTSGKKKVVPYTLRSLIIGTCAVIQSWGLREADINREFRSFAVCPQSFNALQSTKCRCFTLEVSFAIYWDLCSQEAVPSYARASMALHFGGWRKVCNPPGEHLI